MKPNDPTQFDLVHTILSVLFIGLLIVLSFWIMRPFLLPLIWGGLIVVATWPLLLNLDKWLGGKRGLAVTIMTLAVAFMLLAPLTLAVVMIVSHIDNIPGWIQSINFSALSTPPDWIHSIPLAGKKIAERWVTFAALTPEARWEVITPYARAAIQWFAAKAGSITGILINAVLALILSAVLYLRGDMVRTAILRFARRLAGRHGEEAALLAAKAARGVVLGVVGTAVVQSLVGTVALLVARVPAASVLAAVMFLFCLAQLGPMLVLIPVVIWLYWSGHPALGTVVLILTVVAGTIDNVVRPLLIRKGVKLPLLLIFGGVIGGLMGFGVIGLFIGPVLLAVAHTLLKAWVMEGDANSN